MNQGPDLQTPQDPGNRHQPGPQGQCQQPQGQYRPEQWPNPQNPGFPAKTKQPKWVVLLIVVAAVSLLLCAVLIGVLIGGRGNAPQPVPQTAPEAAGSKAPASVPELIDPSESFSSEAPPAPPQPAGEWSLGDCVEEAIDWIEDSKQFVKRYDFEPLGCVADFDMDGCQDFLAAYEAEAANGTRYVAYCVFTFLEDGPSLLKDGVLYQEVGGNGGSVGIAKGKDGTIYLTRFTRTPDGNGPHNFYEYEPWDTLGSFESNIFCMESQWDVESPEKGTYLLGSQKVDQSAFESSRKNYEDLYLIDLVAGHGNGDAGGVDFDTLEKWYDD